MHLPRVVMLDPVDGHGIAVHDGIKDLVPPTYGFQEIAPGFDMGILIRIRNPFMMDTQGLTHFRPRFTCTLPLLSNPVECSASFLMIVIR